MKTKIYLVILLPFLLLNLHVTAQNTFPSSGKVGIGTTTPNASSLLEVASTTKGILIPRMTQAQRNAITSPATSLFVYVTDVNPGFYFYSGTAWVGLVAKNTGWLLKGNSSLDSASNFIGTTDKSPFSIRTNNVERMHVSSTGNTGIGTTTPNTSSLLEVASTTKGMLIPRMTEAQRNAIASPATSLIIYQTDNNPGFFYYTGTGWLGLASKINTWNVTGNSTIDSASNFIGTTGNSPFSIRTNNIERVHVSSTGNTGIGTTTPQAKLDVNGDAHINGLTIGRGSGNNISNSAFGNLALYSNTNGYYNTATGNSTLYSNTSGSLNTANGVAALASNTTGSENTANGYYALYSNTTANYNTATGNAALYSNTTGYDNTATGDEVLASNTTGTGNTANGYATLYLNTTGGANTANGYASLYSNTTGFDNTANGYYALYSNTTGFLNTANGYYALYSTTSGNDNVAEGNRALYSNTTGSLNTAFGVQADVTSGDLSNTTALGFTAIVDATNKVRVGNTNVTSIGGQVGWTSFSDGRYKRNIKEDVQGLAFINALRPVTYTLDLKTLNDHYDAIMKTRPDSIKQKLRAAMKESETTGSKIVYNGFIAQEVEAAAVKLNYSFSGVDKPATNDGVYGLRYSDFVVPLVKGEQELSKENDSLKIIVNSLQDQINQLKAMIVSSANTNQSTLISSASLQQNIPNPFSSSTTIGYNLPSNYSSANIILTDAKGVVLKQINLSSKGKGNVQLDASTLASGAYRYSLYVDGRMVDSKQMISSK